MNTRTAAIIARLALAVVLVLGPAFLLSAEGFEGGFSSSISAKGSVTESDGVLKGQMVKVVPRKAVEIEKGVEGYPIIDFARKKITIVSTKDKYYLEMPLDQYTKAIDAKAVKVRQSGRTDTLLGHAVEEWLLDEPSTGLEISLWATREYSVGVNLFISLQKLYPNEGLVLGRMGKAVIGQGFLPLKATVSDKSGTLLAWQLVSLQPGAVKDSEFAVPAGYGKMSDVLKKNRGSGSR
jgi:hypothetical protein